MIHIVIRLKYGRFRFLPVMRCCHGWSSRVMVVPCNSVTCATTVQRKINRVGKPVKKLAAVAIAIGVAFAAMPIAHADGNWIAMAMSDSTGHISISDGGASTQAAAEQAVMQACRKRVSDCRVLASGPGGCIALAVNAAHTKYFGGWGPTSDEAEAAALAAAGGGTVLKDQGHCLGDPTNQ